MFSWVFHCKRNDGTAGAALLRKILPETGRSPDGNHSEDSDHDQANDQAMIRTIRQEGRPECVSLSTDMRKLIAA